MAANRLQLNELNRCVGIVVARLKMKLDSPLPNNERQRILLVEGKTDEEFFDGVLENDVKCYSMGGILKARDAIKKDDVAHAVNNKEAIMKTVYGLNVLPTMINVKGAENWDVYGVVDRDYEDFSEYERSKRLYVTDTHDIETLIISSDSDIWGRIEGCVISPDNIKKAFFVSFQLAFLRDAIKKTQKVTIRPVKSGSNEVSFSEFVDNCMISLTKLLGYINERNKENAPDEVLSKKEQDKLVQDILHDRNYKKTLTPEGLVKSSLETFETQNTNSFWVLVDGHDILALIKYYDENAATRYFENSPGALHRKFEMDLIRNYDKRKFQGTTIHAQMLKDRVVKVY